jgi:hypothetical protein
MNISASVVDAAVNGRPAGVAAAEGPVELYGQPGKYLHSSAVAV